MNEKVSIRIHLAPVIYPLSFGCEVARCLSAYVSDSLCFLCIGLSQAPLPEINSFAPKVQEQEILNLTKKVFNAVVPKLIELEYYIRPEPIFVCKRDESVLLSLSLLSLWSRSRI